MCFLCIDLKLLINLLKILFIYVLLHYTFKVKYIVLLTIILKLNIFNAPSPSLN